MKFKLPTESVLLHVVGYNATSQGIRVRILTYDQGTSQFHAETLTLCHCTNEPWLSYNEAILTFEPTQQTQKEKKTGDLHG